MPSYKYKCDKCAMTISIVRGIKEEEHKPACINCSLTMTRVYDKPALAFRGTGWGKDD